MKIKKLLDSRFAFVSLTASDLRLQRRHCVSSDDASSDHYGQQELSSPNIPESQENQLNSVEPKSIFTAFCSLAEFCHDPSSGRNEHNRTLGPNLSIICQRFQLSDRARAVVVNAVSSEI